MIKQWVKKWLGLDKNPIAAELNKFKKDVELARASVKKLEIEVSKELTGFEGKLEEKIYPIVFEALKLAFDKSDKTIIDEERDISSFGTYYRNGVEGVYISKLRSSVQSLIKIVYEETLNENANKVTQSEKFIDDIVERIKKKQL